MTPQENQDQADSKNVEVESIFSDKTGSSLANYPHAKRVGRFLYLSGISARQSDNSVIGVQQLPSGSVVRSISLQTTATLQNMENVLEAAGGSLKDLIDITVFLADISDYSKFNAVYNTYFDAKTGPARTTVGVSSLPGKNLLIEIKGVAYLP